MRHFLMVCVVSAIPFVAGGCGGGGVNSTNPLPKLGSGTVRVTVINPFTSTGVAGATVTQSLDYNNVTQQPINVVTTQVTDASGNTTFNIVPNSENCFTIPITPTYGLIRAVDCSFPVESQVTLNQI